MPRSAKRRFVQFPPAAVFFKPQGVPLRALEKVVLGLDEYEMLRLVDYEGRDIETAAAGMGVSRATGGRILEAARRKSAEALTQGKAVLIEGGAVVLGGRRFRCGSCGAVWGASGGNAADGIAGPSGLEAPQDGCPSCSGSNIVDLGRGWRRDAEVPGPESRRGGFRMMGGGGRRGGRGTPRDGY